MFELTWTNVDGVVDTLNSFMDVLRYNGYESSIERIYDTVKQAIEENKQTDMFYVVSAYKCNLSQDPDAPDRIFFSTLVMMFGEYGTSPRTGWIEPKYWPEVRDITGEWLKQWKELMSNVY